MLKNHSMCIAVAFGALEGADNTTQKKCSNVNKKVDLQMENGIKVALGRVQGNDKV